MVVFDVESQGHQQRPQRLSNSTSSTATTPAAAAAAACVDVGSPRVNPIPAVTMVFVSVEGSKLFGSRRKQLFKDIHSQLSLLLMEALRHIPGGYMCRMQVGD